MEVVQRLFHAFCMEEWMQEQYLPSRIIEYRENLLKEMQERHALFCKLVAMKEILNPSVCYECLWLCLVDFFFSLHDRLFESCYR